MLKKIVLVFAALALAKAQLPSWGCPDYVPMPGFDIERFLGIWHEAERYFQITEIISRCVTSNYTRGPDGKLRVYNEVTNRFTGVKRTVEGEIKPAASKADQGKLHVKYTTVPLAPETDYTVLETDYTTYAVLWGCSGIGPFSAQNAWLLTRELNPSGETMQAAYGVLDRHKIWKRLFVKSDQVDCSYEASTPAPAVAVTPSAAAAPAAVPASVPVKEEPVIPESVPAAKKSIEGIHLRSSSALLQDAEPIDESRKETIESAVAEELADSSISSNEQPAVENLRLAKPSLPEFSADKIRRKEIFEQASVAPETIPEVILKFAESSKENSEPVVPSFPAEDSVPTIPEKLKTVDVAALPESQPELIPETKPFEEAADPVPVVKKIEIAIPESDEILPQKGADSILAGEESKIEEVVVLPEAKPLKDEAEEEKLVEIAVEETKVSELPQETQPEVIVPVAVEPPKKAEDNKAEIGASEEPKASESAPESIPEEKASFVDSAPAEEPLPIVAAPEESKPLEDVVEKKDENISEASKVVDIETPETFGQLKNEEIITAEKITETKFSEPKL